MEEQPKRQWGVTQAISHAPPKDEELKLNDKLVAALTAENNFETPEQTKARHEVLAHLHNVVVEFIRRVGQAKGLPASTVDNAGGRVCFFGSFALGVHNPGSDIDTLVVAPKHVNLMDFFDQFPAPFHEMTPASEITEFTPVPTAAVPIFKITLRGVNIDLLFVSLPGLSRIEKDLDLTQKSLIRGLDEAQIRSINGTRTVQELNNSIPQPKPFRLALRAVKLWAKRRGIYGNVFGYPGGIAWAIMVARICQLYPYACGSTILVKFFNLMGKWHWPRPVMLKHIEEGSLHLKVWNPTLYSGDRAHLMPIITPAFPSMCATHTISHSTKDVMMKEFKRAEDMLGSILDGKRAWADLWRRSTFFTEDHRYYLSVIASARTKEQSDKFVGMVQAKLRHIVKGIDEGVEAIDVARPFPEPKERIHRCENEDQINSITLGSLDFEVKKEDLEKEKAAAAVDETMSNGEATKAQFTIYTTTFYIGLTIAPTREGEPKQKLDVSYPVADFKRMVQMANEYDEEINSIQVVHTRNYDLPLDLFREGETRAAGKPVKEKKKKSNSKSVKRPIAETGFDGNEQSGKRRQPEKVNGHATPTPA